MFTLEFRLFVSWRLSAAEVGEHYGDYLDYYSDEQDKVKLVEPVEMDFYVWSIS